MLKVGDFSKLANVTIKTLRHYDRLSLLKPVWIDRYTGYRYYALDQLPRLQRILALKDLGFTLSQVRKLLDDNLSAAELRQMLNHKQAELESHVEEEQVRLKHVAERLLQIEQEGRLPLHEVMLRSIPELTVASVRLVLKDAAEQEQKAARLRAELRSWITTNRLRSHEQWLTLVHHPASLEQRLDVEIALVIDEPPQPVLRSIVPPMQVLRLPPVKSMACLLLPNRPLHGVPALVSAYTSLLTWAERGDYTVYSPARELLLEDPSPGESHLQYIEVQIPVESASERKNRLLDQLVRKEEDMQPKFVELPAFTVVGMRYYGRNEHQEISGLWGEFNMRVPEIQHVTPGSAAYGVCITPPDAPNGEFEYVASFQVDSITDIPEGMVSRQVPAGKYAVFTHEGSLEKLCDTYHYIYQVWLPQSGYQIGAGLDFEYYDEDFKDFAPDSKFYIYVPVK
jgi:predicted transcriptional regulator YdeE/DNA-binding transcriptional MerR regulator